MVLNQQKQTNIDAIIGMRYLFINSTKFCRINFSSSAFKKQKHEIKNNLVFNSNAH